MKMNRCKFYSAQEKIFNNMRTLVLTAVIIISSYGLIAAAEETAQLLDPVSLNAPQMLKDEPRINILFSVPLEYTAGTDFGAFYDFRADLYINRYLNFFTNFRLGPNIPLFNAFSAGWDMTPLSFFRFGIRYQLENFPAYRILEQNAAVITAFFPKNNSKPRWFDFEFLLGADFRFIDLDMNNASSIYRRDWLFELFILYRFDFLFHPIDWFSTGFSFGNFNESLFFSSNYFQVEFRMIFKLPKRVSIFVKGGFAFSAFLMNPGYINKGWGEAGLSYEIPFK